jgi:hypothetical protein
MGASALGKWFVWGGIAVVVLVGVALAFLPGHLKIIAFAVIAVATVAVYGPLVSKALKPVRDSVDLYVDPTGVYADGAPLALHDDIRQAYIRPAYTRQTRSRSSYGSLGYVQIPITTPDYPMTVELMTRKGQVNIDAGSEQAATAILTALGVPVTVCTPDYRASMSRRQWVMSAVVVVVFIGGLLAYSAYMQHQALGRH